MYMESSDRERILLFNIKSLESPLGKKRKKEKKIDLLYLQVFLWTVIIIMRC